MIMDKEELKEKIRKAFHGVELGDGVGLWEANADEDYCGNFNPSEYKEKDERRDWTVLSAETLISFQSTPFFFDADGMRFHLPAFLLADIDDLLDRRIVYHLIRKQNFETLDKAQRQAVADFLRWCLTQNLYEDDWSDIEAALKLFWEVS